jgi:hypothetical protein
LDPYTPVLHQSWEAGCHHVMHLWRTLRAQGLPGSSAVVYWDVTTLRRGQPVRPSGPACAPVARQPIQPPRLTARPLSSLFVRRPDKRTPDEPAHRAQRQQHDPTITPMAALTEAYFGKNDDYPCTRADWKKHDPVGDQLMQQPWKITRCDKRKDKEAS